MGDDEAAARRIREQQLRHWNTVAGGWAAWLEWTERNFNPVTEWLAEATAWTGGARVLDVACGAGYPALIAASRVQPGGTVVATDFSPAMLAAAAGGARAAGLKNVEFREMDAEYLQFDAGSFDVVSNVYGLMFCPDPQRAIAEAYRVLDRRGRCAVVTWDEPAKSPFFSVITAVAAPMLSLAAPAAGAPGPFRLSSPGELESMLRASGFSHVRVERRPATFDVASVDEYCRMFGDLAWKSRMAALSKTEAARLRDKVEEAVQPYIQNGRVRLVATSLCACGAKA